MTEKAANQLLTFQQRMQESMQDMQESMQESMQDMANQIGKLAYDINKVQLQRSQQLLQQYDDEEDEQFVATEVFVQATNTCSNESVSPSSDENEVLETFKEVEKAAANEQHSSSIKPSPSTPEQSLVIPLRVEDDHSISHIGLITDPLHGDDNLAEFTHDVDFPDLANYSENFTCDACTDSYTCSVCADIEAYLHLDSHAGITGFEVNHDAVDEPSPTLECTGLITAITNTSDVVEVCPPLELQIKKPKILPTFLEFLYVEDDDEQLDEEENNLKDDKRIPLLFPSPFLLFHHFITSSFSFSFSISYSFSFSNSFSFLVSYSFSFTNSFALPIALIFPPHDLQIRKEKRRRIARNFVWDVG